ncbi:MAG TPA: hypothetical protein VGF48_20910 [Thermoanaerobaculia bacterium]|jgi:hypothetical protein
MWAVIVVVAVVAWTAARLQSEPRVDAPVVAPVARAVEAPPTFEPDIPRVQHVAFAGAPNRNPNRNLFSYVVPPVKAEPVVETAPVPIEAPKPVVEVAAAREPEPPAFSYRYLGRFGREATPLAAFSRDGEVVVRRAGERIDPSFVLLRIGAESVDIAAEDGMQRVVRRVPIGN